jgi:hypothetical protein
MRRLWYLSVLALAALLGLPATAAAAPPEIGHFPIEEQVDVVEPESSVCGFPISWTRSGQGTFQVFFDADGNPTRLRLFVVIRGELSANGITLQIQQAYTRHFDFVDNTVAETGLIFHYRLPGTGVVLSDRGRLVFNLDPETGEYADLIFEAGPHPTLHGDFGDLCAVLTP